MSGRKRDTGRWPLAATWLIEEAGSGMQSKRFREARRLKASMRRHLKKSRAIAMLGFELEAVSQGRASLRLGVEPRHKQLKNAGHGGILGARADTAGGIAARTP